MFKKVLYGIVSLPLSIVAGVSCALMTLMFVLDKPVQHIFGMKDEYNEGLDNLIDTFEELADALKFDD